MSGSSDKGMVELSCQVGLISDGLLAYIWQKLGTNCKREGILQAHCNIYGQYLQEKQVKEARGSFGISPTVEVI